MGTKKKLIILANIVLMPYMAVSPANFFRTPITILKISLQRYKIISVYIYYICIAKEIINIKHIGYEI
jgi:hypothetical protein